MTTASYYAGPWTFDVNARRTPIIVSRSVDAVVMSEDDDLTLIQRVVARDRHAFETLYRRYYQRLYGYLLKMLRRPDLVEEVLNDVMMVVWSSAGRFNHQSKFSTWMFGIAYNKALKAFNNASKHPPEPDTNLPEMLDLEGPERALMRQETREALGQALQSLSPTHRSVIEFAFFHGFSYSEIAEMMDCPVNTVKTRIYHARKHLTQLLAQPTQHRHEDRR